ncbi:hypothetical protein, partial [Burkholderia pseudomallei]|uniref:hypothetical protein n=1 Tax=Burkholderia pseudomallei TaxID=28450 RepID=UPI0015C3A058
MAHSRDYGGSFTLNNLDDGTPIKEMLSLGKYLYLITEKCTYRVQMADQVDPERKNLVHRRKPWSLGERLRNLTPDFMDVR